MIRIVNENEELCTTLPYYIFCTREGESRVYRSVAREVNWKSSPRVGGAPRHGCHFRLAGPHERNVTFWRPTSGRVSCFDLR